MYASEIVTALAERPEITSTERQGRGYLVRMADGTALMLADAAAGGMSWAHYNKRGRRYATSWVPDRAMVTPQNMLVMLDIAS